MGSAVDNLLLYLKGQLLALLSLARWALLTFAGIVMLREAFGMGWEFHQRRLARARLDALGQGTAAQDALPAPNPLAQSSIQSREAAKGPMPGRHSRPDS